MLQLSSILRILVHCIVPNLRLCPWCNERCDCLTSRDTWAHFCLAAVALLGQHGFQNGLSRGVSEGSWRQTERTSHQWGLGCCSFIHFWYSTYIKDNSDMTICVALCLYSSTPYPKWNGGLWYGDNGYYSAYLLYKDMQAVSLPLWAIHLILSWGCES